MLFVISKNGVELPLATPNVLIRILPQYTFDA